MKKRESKLKSASKLVIITGLSGSGMSSATNAFEDVGYFCVDNLPLTMLSTFARLLLPGDEGSPAIEKAALVINIRERQFLSEFPTEIRKLTRRGIKPFVIFFEASDEVLLRRFSETRRPHPAYGQKTLLSAIKAERKAMLPIRQLADMIIDTSEHTVHTLRKMLVERFSATSDGNTLKINIVSFGHKHGLPKDLDLLFDVRHLPNPYFVSSLRDKTGEDAKVIEFMDKSPLVKKTEEHFAKLLLFLLPQYKAEGKAYLTIGIGCTGGKHRSVKIANSLKEILKQKGWQVTVNHRDMQK